MYVVLDHNGKQYKASEDQEFLIDLMDVAVGDLVEFDRVLLVGGLEGEPPRVGTPQVPGARVLAEVLRHEKGPKLRGMKYQQRTGGRNPRYGHRQRYTRVLVREIHPE